MQRFDLMALTLPRGAQWLSNRVPDSRPRGRVFMPHRHHCVVSLTNLDLCQGHWNMKYRPRSPSHSVFVCVDSLHLRQEFFSYVGTGLPGLNQYYEQSIKCLAQGHNAVPPVRLEPTTP